MYSVCNFYSQNGLVGGLQLSVVKMALHGTNNIVVWPRKVSTILTLGNNSSSTYATSLPTSNQLDQNTLLDGMPILLMMMTKSSIFYRIPIWLMHLMIFWTNDQLPMLMHPSRCQPWPHSISWWCIYTQSQVWWGWPLIHWYWLGFWPFDILWRLNWYQPWPPSEPDPGIHQCQGIKILTRMSQKEEWCTQHYELPPSMMTTINFSKFVHISILMPNKLSRNVDVLDAAHGHIYQLGMAGIMWIEMIY